MSSYLAGDLRAIKDQLMVKFLTDPIFQLNDADYEAVAQARQMIIEVYEYKACHTASCGLFASGKYKCGTHIYCRRMHEFSVCAEHRIFERTNWTQRRKSPDMIETLATFHGAHDSSGNRIGDPYLVSPCEKCLRLLRQLCPDCLVVVDLDGANRLAKIPLDAVDFFRHPSNHNNE